MATRKAAPAKSQAKLKAPAKDPATLRATLLADPTTKGIAKNLGVPLEDYVEQVLHFAANPQEEPSLYVVEDEDLRQLGYEPPDEEAMGQYLVEAVAVTDAADKTEYTAPKKKLVTLDSAPKAQPTGKTDTRLKSDLEKQLRGKRGGKS